MNISNKLGWPRIEIFYWTHRDKSISISFFINEILFDISAKSLPYEEVLVEIEEDFAKNTLMKQDYDLLHCLSLSEERLKEPVIGCYWADNSVILIDGTHRYIRHYMDRRKTIVYRLIKYQDWQRAKYSRIMRGKLPQ